MYTLHPPAVGSSSECKNYSFVNVWETFSTDRPSKALVTESTVTCFAMGNAGGGSSLIFAGTDSGDVIMWDTRGITESAEGYVAKLCEVKSGEMPVLFPVYETCHMSTSERPHSSAIVSIVSEDKMVCSLDDRGCVTTWYVADVNANKSLYEGDLGVTGEAR